MMMTPYIINETEITPRVLLDRTKGQFLIQGKSLPEDAKGFYTPIIEWFDEYSKNPNDHTELLLAFDYFNTASSKMILIVLAIMRSIKMSGWHIEIVWKYPQYDVELEEAGEEFAELLGLPFQFIPVV